MPDFTRSEFTDEILTLPVWDTHTHLESSAQLTAQSIWDIVHYFWFGRELFAAGYPADPMKVPEEKRIALFLEAFGRARNTYWNRAVREMLSDLYGVIITDRKSVLEANQRIAANARRSECKALFVSVQLFPIPCDLYFQHSL